MDDLICQLDAKVHEAWNKFTEEQRYGTNLSKERAYGYYCGMKDIFEFLKNKEDQL